MPSRRPEAATMQETTKATLRIIVTMKVSKVRRLSVLPCLRATTP